MELILTLDNIRSAYNVGAILRTAEGFGVSRALLSGYTPRVHDASLLPHLRDKIDREIHKTALGAEDMLDIYSSTEKFVYRCFFDDDVIERIEIRDSVTFELKSQTNQIVLWPATQYLQDTEDLENILQQIDAEKELRIKEFERAGMMIEAERIKKRVEKAKEERKTENSENGKDEETISWDNKEYVKIEANSMDELVNKVSKYAYDNSAKSILTDTEKTLGQNFDFKG